MSPAIIPTIPPIPAADQATVPPTAGVSDAGAVPDDVIDNLTVRLAGADEREAITELARRAGSARRPKGATMVAAIDGRLLAAVSIGTAKW